MNIRTAIAALCASALFGSAVKADVVGTITAFPSVAGETTYIHLAVTGDVYDPHFYYQGAYWEAMPWENYVTFYDGLGGSELFYSSFFVGLFQTSWFVPVVYPDAGTFFPHFDADISFRLTRARMDDADCAQQWTRILSRICKFGR